MKISFTLLALAFSVIIHPVCGQQETEIERKQEPVPVKKTSIKDFYVQAGFFNSMYYSNSIDDFRLLAPNSVLLNNDMTGFTPLNGMGMYSNSMFSFNLGLRLSNKERTSYHENPLLRFGVTYFSHTALSGVMHKEERRPYDTLTSSQTGQSMYVDSVITENYWMNYSSNQLRFDASVIFRTNPAARWSLYAGMGLTAGISMNARTYVSYAKYGNTETYGPNYNETFYGDYTTTYAGTMERFKNKSGFGGTLYLPLGVDFQIGKKNEFWKQVHLFYEIRAGLNIISIPELYTTASTAVQHGIGIRLSLE